MEISSNIKMLRAKYNWTQRELGDRAHVHQTAVGKWESGENDPSLKQAVELAVIFEVSLDYLTGLTNEPRPGYMANNVNLKDSNFVQNGSVTVNGETKSKEDTEAMILRIYRDADFQGKAKMVCLAAELEKEITADKELLK